MCHVRAMHVPCACRVRAVCVPRACTCLQRHKLARARIEAHALAKQPSLRAMHAALKRRVDGVPLLVEREPGEDIMLRSQPRDCLE